MAVFKWHSDIIPDIILVGTFAAAHAWRAHVKSTLEIFRFYSRTTAQNMGHRCGSHPFLQLLENTEIPWIICVQVLLMRSQR